MKPETKDLTLIEETHSIVKPAVTTTEAIEAFKQFEEIKDKVLSDEDKESIKNKPYIRKSGWRKIRTIFNLSEEILESTRIDNVDGSYKWIFKVRVKAKNGAFADAQMSCDSKEPFGVGKTEAAVMAMAQTRAYNRAISDLVGGGAPSAEEAKANVEDEETIPEETIKNVTPKPNVNKLLCVTCKEPITQKVYEYSMQHMGASLCVQHQKEWLG